MKGKFKIMETAALSFSMMILTLLLSCKAPETGTKKVIKDYLQLNLNDFRSYEPLEYGEMDCITEYDVLVSKMQTYAQRIQGLQAQADYASHMVMGNTIDENSRGILDSWCETIDCGNNIVAIRDEMYMINEKLETQKDKLKRDVVVWYMTHKYRTRNRVGATIIVEQVFYFNPEKTEIVKVEDIDE